MDDLDQAIRDLERIKSVRKRLKEHADSIRALAGFRSSSLDAHASFTYGLENSTRDRETADAEMDSTE